MRNKTKLKIVGILAVVGLVVTLLTIKGLVGYNVDQNWQVVQRWGGNLDIIETGGPYVKVFAPNWTYPKTTTSYFSADDKEGGREDDSIRVTFNDGGTAKVSTAVRYTTAVGTDNRKQFHIDMSGDMEFAESAMRAHLINVLKNTAPMMSASEHQSARKSEFDRLVYDQLIQGTYETRKVEKVLKDQFDEKGKAITVFATEIVLGENGLPKIAKPNPLAQYGIQIQQFSVTSTDYDKITLDQFEAKKESYLRAEKSKAQQQEMVQERLMIEERGRKDKAEVEAIALKEKAQAVIQAEKEKEVAETQAAKQLAVAKLEKMTAETQAEKLLEVARLEKQASEETAQARKILADAKKYELEQAGGLSDELAAILNANVQIATVTSENFAKINVPSNVFFGGGSGMGTEGGSMDLTQAMFGYKMWQDTNAATMTPTPTGKLNTVNAGGGEMVTDR